MQQRALPQPCRAAEIAQQETEVTEATDNGRIAREAAEAVGRTEAKELAAAAEDSQAVLARPAGARAAVVGKVRKAGGIGAEPTSSDSPRSAVFAWAQDRFRRKRTQGGNPAA